MGILNFTLKRVAPAAAATSLATWASITTINDDWDDYFPPQTEDSKEERIVILGSGWAALSALRKCASPGKSVVVVSPRPHFLYTPLLASSSVGTITLRSACEPLRALVDSAATKASSASFVRADARSVDPESQTVIATTDSAGTMLHLTYDKLVIAVGAQPNTFGIPGVSENALFLKEAQDSAKLHAKLLSNLEKAAALIRHTKGDQYKDEIERLLKIVVVGGGPTGVELAAELADFAGNDVATLYGNDISNKIKIVLVEAMPRILAPFEESLADVARQHLISKGVDVRTNCAVTNVDQNTVTFSPATPKNATPEEKALAKIQISVEETGALVWAAGIGARPLVKKLATKLKQQDTRGLKVDENLRVKGCNNVYAIGDAALSGYAPTAQVAAQQGKHIGRAIRDGVDSPFVYHHTGSLCCLGSDNAIAQLVGSSQSTFNVWDLIGADAIGPDQRALIGTPAFVLWRSLYFTKLLSTSSRFSLFTDWTRSKFSGRYVQEPVLQRQPTLIPEFYGTDLKRNSTIKFVKEELKTQVAKKKRFWIV